MADARPVTIVRARANPALLITGDIEPRTTIQFMVGSDGPFEVTVKDTEFSAERVKQLMEQKAAEIRKLY